MWHQHDIKINYLATYFDDIFLTSRHNYLTSDSRNMPQYEQKKGKKKGWIDYQHERVLDGKEEEDGKAKVIT